MKIENTVCCVAGGAGFLGSHLVNHLIEDRGCEVIVLDNLVVGRKDFLHPTAIFEWCDISISEGHIYKILKKHKVEYAFNYAAIPYVPVSYVMPLTTFDVNARGALMFIHAAADAGAKRILQVSSAEIYGDATGRISEDHPASPHSSYGASKLAIDTLVQARWKEAGIPCIALRQFNCVGDRDILHPYVIPEIIDQLQVSNVVKLGNNTSRDFMYAGDAVAMATELLEAGECGQVYNLGSESVVKIYDLAVYIASIMGKTPMDIQTDSSRFRPWDIEHLQSDNTKIYSVIKRRPQISLEAALEKTINSLEYWRAHDSRR